MCGTVGRAEKYVKYGKLDLEQTMRMEDPERGVKNEYELVVTVVKDIKYEHFCFDCQRNTWSS